MADFKQAIQVVLKHEGGLVENVADPGGITNYGISLRFLAQHPHDGDFNHDGTVDAEDIANMSVEDAKDLYRKFFWDPYNYDRIPDQTLATKIFDFCVNMGAKRAHMLLQEAINNAFDLNLTCDGILGPASMRVLCSIADGDDEQRLIQAYSDAVWDFYQQLIENNPKLKVFQRGWRNRAYSIGSANSMS